MGQVAVPVRRGKNLGKKTTMLGLISDTHGLLREDAVRALRGSDLILHAGDVGASSAVDRSHPCGLGEDLYAAYLAGLGP